MKALLRRKPAAPTIVPTVPSVKQAQHALWQHGDPLGVEPDDRGREMWAAYACLSKPARTLMAVRHPGFAAAFEMSFEWAGFEELRSIVKRAQDVLDTVDADGYVRAVSR
ncbi:hypothetical protein [Clavibacter sp. VKM Ac-2872]|uniref:hypothetical protein n=1 Tax=Clavibacter sp. VKM Ac-2872 TaxID=2783812 RepID=UPI00188B939E|nr:hypothetical protein [Clavibacter sp. VKM Ac-2872]MBF4625510.1 hypothetical protein [Clavibacter sp. VKM Ac-2872]